MGFVNAVLAITDPGDEIILNTPYYFNHEMAITMADCKAVCVPTDENYQLRPEPIEKAITTRTRAVVTISPNNPSGAVYPEKTLRQVNDLCRRHGIYHISDEAYEYFIYDGARHFSPGSIAGSSQHTISLFSLSKAYGFASWRIGWMVIPERLFRPIRKIQDTILICPPVISQWAAVGAMRVGPVLLRREAPRDPRNPHDRPERTGIDRRPRHRSRVPTAHSTCCLASTRGWTRCNSSAADGGAQGRRHSRHDLRRAGPMPAPHRLRRPAEGHRRRGHRPIGPWLETDSW